MNNLITNIEIENFKSIKRLTLKDCKRINLLIGKPNVGKSNILEALSVFSLPHIKYNSNKGIENYIRVENRAELFYNGDLEHEIKILTNNFKAFAIYPNNSLTNNIKKELTINLNFSVSGADLIIDEKLKAKLKIYKPEIFPVKKYAFKPKIEFKKQNLEYLLPPYGENLLGILEIFPELKKEFTRLFQEYGLKMIFDKGTEEIKLMKEDKDSVFLIPFNSIADTLQRIIFFKTAIVSNKDSVILLEEPEAHSYPPYIVHITQEIINSQTNQFFITTHSPYVVNDFLESGRKELAIFMVDLKDGQTIIKRLSDEEINDIYNYGIDLFINSETYLK